MWEKGQMSGTEAELSLGLSSDTWDQYTAAPTQQNVWARTTQKKTSLINRLMLLGRSREQLTTAAKTTFPTAL